MPLNTGDEENDHRELIDNGEIIKTIQNYTFVKQNSKTMKYVKQLAALGLCDRIVDNLLKKYNMINLEDKKVKSFQQEYMESINMRLYNRFECD